MTLEKALEHAAEHLPEGWTVHISVEKGSGWVNAERPDGTMVDMYEDETDLEEQRRAAALSCELSESKAHITQLEVEVKMHQKRELASIQWGNRKKAELEAKIKQLERERDNVIERFERLANAANVLWDEHKAFGEDMHDTEGVDYMGTDSEGHQLMQELVDEMLIIDCPECMGTGEPEPTESGEALPPCARCQGTGLISCQNS